MDLLFVGRNILVVLVINQFEPGRHQLALVGIGWQVFFRQLADLCSTRTLLIGYIHFTLITHNTQKPDVGQIIPPVVRKTWLMILLLMAEF